MATIFLVFGLLGASFIGGIPAHAQGNVNPEFSKSERRGLWIAYTDFANLGLKDKTQTQFETNMKNALNKARTYGVNTIYFHVRSFDDAAWKSSTFPASSALTSKASSSKTAAQTYTYDPLAITLRLAHSYGMELHAYMNPYRVSSNYFWDPSDAKTNARILTAVKEVLAYNVDGVHFDDYFYHAAKGYYRVGDTSKKVYSAPLSAATKRANVNVMVRSVYNLVHTTRASFGISPQGNWENCMNGGSDVATWLSTQGYVDYLVPQIYWSNQWGSNGATAMFSQRLQLFKSKNTAKIPMYVGLAAYRTGYAQSDDRGWGWRSDNLATQISLVRNAGLNGFAFFSASDLLRARAATEFSNVQKIVKPTIVTQGVTKPTSLVKGSSFALTGTVTSSAIIKRIEVGIANNAGTAYVSKKYYNNTSVNAKSFNISQVKSVTFSDLPVGSYRYRIWVHTFDGAKAVIDAPFTVTQSSAVINIKNYTAPTTLAKGKGFVLKGTITSSLPIKRVEIGVVSKNTANWVSGVKYDNAKLNTYSFSIAQADNYIKFGKLAKGSYYYRIWVHTSDGKAKMILNKGFTVS
ncbi:MAG: family 10 glycosylhydrolase [Actinomycetaceae bacterium]|nr:family 10 glycosylhydrolase [Actinomycetaceae bacterium]